MKTKPKKTSTEATVERKERWERFKINGAVPDGRSGEWSVSTIECSERQALISAIQSIQKSDHRNVVPGRYTRLMRGNTVVMSDTRAEIEDVLPFIESAKGSILIAGLGLGLVPAALAKSPRVSEVVILEKSRDVIALTGARFYCEKKVRVIVGDIFKDDHLVRIARQRYDMAWFDIWDDISPDNLPEMLWLEKKYASICEKMEFWCRDMILEHIRHELTNRSGDSRFLNIPQDVILEAVLKTAQKGKKYPWEE